MTRWPVACQVPLSMGFSRKEYWKVKVAQLCRLFATPWTIQSMEFSRPEYWSGYPFPSPGDLPNLRIEPRSPALQADSFPRLPFPPAGDLPNPGIEPVSSESPALAGGFFTTEPLGKSLVYVFHRKNINNSK